MKPRKSGSWLHLTDALMCLDCEALYHRRFEACPSCTAHTHIALHRILNRPRPAPTLQSLGGLYVDAQGMICATPVQS